MKFKAFAFLVMCLVYVCSFGAVREFSVGGYEIYYESDNVLKGLDRSYGYFVIVEKVVDGDTLHLRKLEDWVLVKLRILGVDTPETVHPTKDVEAFGVEASAFTKSVFPVGSFALVIEDSRSKRDVYGRTLGYLYFSELLDTDQYVWFDYSEVLILNGFGKVYRKSKCDNYTIYLEAEEYAKKHLLGLWGL